MKISCLIASLFPLATAWIAPQEMVKKAVAFGATATLAAAPIISNAKPADFKGTYDFNGMYYDPFHPNCIRVVEVDGTKAFLKGTDGNPGCPADGSGKEWTLTGKVFEDKIFVDFSPKGGPRDYKGVFDGNGIKWSDGNKWPLKHKNMNELKWL